MQERSSENLILAGVVGLGVVLRVRQFLFAKSLWLDEATFANGILDSPLLDLLTVTQRFVDPAGYVVLTKLSVAVFGQTDYAFRWIALAAGIGSVVVSALLAKRVFDRAAARVAFTGLVALAPVLIYYSNEAQQYSLDVLAALAVVWVFVSYEEWRRGFPLLVLTGVLFPWLSYASIIILFGVGLSLAVRWLRKRSYKRIAIIGSAWGLSALIVLIHARIVTRTEFLEDYWTAGFAPFPFNSFSDLRWYPEAAGGIVEMAWFAEGFVPKTPATPSLAAWVIFALVVVGAVLLVRRRPWIGLALGVVVAANFAVSVLGLYPFGSRPGLYMVPLCFLVAVEPLDWAMRRRSWAWRVPAALVAVGLVAVLAVPSLRLFINPENGSDMKGALSLVVGNWEPADALIVQGWSTQAFDFYEPRFELQQHLVREVSREFDVQLFLDELGPDPGLGRTWLLFTHRLHEAEQLVDELAEVAPLLQRSGGESYLVALFDLSALD
ncbi:MAG TPA: hypothetical protein VF148_03385 [Acidimicrobiia bacterium]